MVEIKADDITLARFLLRSGRLAAFATQLAPQHERAIRQHKKFAGNHPA
jgi:hypothetical protein